MTPNNKEGPEKKDAKSVPGNRPIRDAAKREPTAPAVNWESAFRQLGTPAFILAPDHTILSANNITCLLTGKTETELKGRKCWEIFHGNDATHPPKSCPLDQLLSSKKHETGEIEVSLNGRVYLVSCTPVFDDQGAISSIIHIATDIMKIKLAEEMALENENRFRLLFEQSPVPYQSLDADGRFLEVNKAWLDTLGYTQKEVIGNWFGNFIDPGFSEVFRTNFPKFKAAGETHVEFKMKRKDGVLIPVTFNGKIGHYPDGSFRQTHCVFRDITRQKAAEDALKESEKILGDIIEKNPMSIQIVDKDGFTLKVNHAHTLLFGSIPPPDFSIFADLQKKQPALEKLILLVKSGEVVNLPDISYNAHDSFPEFPDVPVWVRAIIFPLNDKYGKPERFVLMHENITERKQAEDALKELSAYNRNLIESSIDPLITISKDGKIQDVNTATEKATGLSRANLIGTDFSEYFTDPKKAREGYNRVFSEGKVLDYPLEFSKRNGSVIPVLYNATVYHDSNGDIRGVFAAARDITERRQAEEIQERLISELARKNAELDRFTYTVSHDLKSPLISIQGFLSLLENDIKSGNADRVQTDIHRITESTKKLERMITTLLALSRSGKSVDTPVKIPFKDIVLDAVRQLDVILRERGVTLAIPDTLPVISGDRQRLVQVMTNLLDNAVKFMGDQKEPRIDIGVHDEGGTPVFFVKDNGMGIRKDDLPKVFGLYERFNPDIPGTGIGLATVKRIIEAHGGKIWVESEGEGKGTTFRFTLPVSGGHTDNNNNG